MRKKYQYLFLPVVLTLLTQCGTYSDSAISYGNMDCSDAVVTTVTYETDSIAFSNEYFSPVTDDFGMSTFYFSLGVKDACPGDSVFCEFICHLAADMPKEVFVGQGVDNSIDPVTGDSRQSSLRIGDLYEITGNGGYMALDYSDNLEFNAFAYVTFESSGEPFDDYTFLKQYFKDVTLRFTYSKISD